MQNGNLIQKADMAVADLAANGGLLNPEQSNAFIKKLLVQPTLLNAARTVVMTGSQKEINKIGFGKRILRAASAGVPLSGAAVDGVFDPVVEATLRAKAQTSKVLLNTSEVIAEIRLPYDVIEDNIERGNVGVQGDSGATGTSGGIKDVIMDMIAERAALDLEELALLGNTANVADPYLALKDGYLTQSVSNVVDALAAPINKGIFKAGVIAMPDQYLRNRSSLRNYISIDNETEYRDTLANRQTALGDANLQGQNRLFAFGTGIEPVALMPAASGLLCDPQNLIFGIQRDISIEVEKDIRAREYIIVLTARVDFKIEEELAVVKYSNIG